jgi:hypothetical protein
MMAHRIMVGMLLAAVCAACAPSAARDDADGTGQWIEYLDARARVCERETAYQPIEPSECRLADGEMAFRQCLYIAINAAVTPLDRDADRQVLFRRLIGHDQALTAEIAAGTITRATRVERLEQLKGLGDRSYQETIDLLTGRRQQLAHTQHVRDLHYLFQLQQELTRSNILLLPSGQ